MYYLEPNKDYRTQSPRQQSTGLLQDIIDYYEETTRDYLSYWCNDETLAIHYGYWDSAEPYNHQQSLLNMNAFLYEKAGIKSTDIVLDAGCGVGGSAIWMAKQHQNKVTGITLSEEQVHHAQQYAKQHQVSELTQFEVASYLATPFADESFDVIWAIESICHSLNKLDFLKEAYRLLRTGGRVVVADGYMMQREFNEQQWQALIKFLNGWSVPNLATIDEFDGLLAGCKFQNIQCTNITEKIHPSSYFMYQGVKRLAPWLKLPQWLRLYSKAQAAHLETGIAQYELFGKTAAYCVFTAQK